MLCYVSAEMYMNSHDLKDKSKEEIQEILRSGYLLYTEMDGIGNKRFDLDEYGYRAGNVALGNKTQKLDVLLHKQGNNIKRAMDNLTNKMNELINSAQKLTEDEYLKQVAMLHFRYISIHPFRDSNGRIGRNIINMLLAQRNKIFVLDRKDKVEYTMKMNNMRNKMPNFRNYLNSLSDNPEICQKYEENTCVGLFEFIKNHTYNNTENIKQKQEEKSIEKWKQNNMPNEYTKQTIVDWQIDD